MNAIAANSGQAQVYTKGIWYRLAASVELVARFEPLDGQTRHVEPYHTDLQKNHLIADGEDQLAVTVFLHRIGAHPAEAVALGEITAAALQSAGAADHELIEDTNFAADEKNVGRKRFLICSKSGRPLAYTQTAVDNPMLLHLEGRVNPTPHGAAAGRRPFAVPPLDVEVRLQFLRLRFWVVPGARGTSDALAHLALFPARIPCTDWTLQLSVENPIGPELTGEGAAAQQTSSTDDAAVHGQRKPLLPKGSARWTLRYSGLSWYSLSVAFFTVRCDVLDKQGSAAVSAQDIINVDQNVRSLLGDLLHDPDMATKLNNPYWENSVLPLGVRGPAWNIMQLFQSVPFVCSHMRAEIISWLERRQLFNQNADPDGEMDHMRSMNGIEYDYYYVWGGHVFAGIFLSGNDRYGDYRCVDPWWQQQWTDPSYATPEGLMSVWGERARFDGPIAAVGLIALAVAAYLGIPVAVALRAVWAWCRNRTKSDILIILGVPPIAAVLTTDRSDQVQADGRAFNYEGTWFLTFIAWIERWQKPGVA